MRDLFGEVLPARPALATPAPPSAARVAAPRAGTEPHFVKLGEAHIFVHPCSVCGAPDAPFGTGVFLRQRKYGTWHCGPCRKAKRP